MRITADDIEHLPPRLQAQARAALNQPDTPAQQRLRQHQPEHDFGQQVLQLYQANQWRAVHFRPAIIGHDNEQPVWATPFDGDRGYFDFTAIHPTGLAVLAELKTDTGTDGPGQTEWRNNAQAVEQRADGAVIVRLWRPTDWPEIQHIAQHQTTPGATT